MKAVYAMDRNADKLFFKAARVLWGDAQVQAQATGESLAPAVDNLLAVVNEWRATQHWPLCTGMLPVELPPCTAEAMIPNDTRALWQMGLLQQLKGIDTGISIMRRSLVPLWAQPETLLGQIALAMEGLLLEDIPLLYPNAAAHCFACFDRLLKSRTEHELTILWEEVHFYATKQLDVSDAGKAALKKRIKHVAGVMAEMLLVKENTDTASKKKLFPHYLSLTDGLLFLGEETLVNRLNRLYMPLPSQLLNISVPVQKLWAQCVSISV
ncbi:MAG: hypothetical protein ACHQAX_01885 [Gammaproteobacteria bacterium]